MKPGPNSKRTRGRLNGKKPSNRQTYDSSGPDVRIRGNAHQVLERYLNLARDAASAGDRIAAENFYQHAEHYYRVISAAGGMPGQHNGGQFRQPYQPHPQSNGHETSAQAEGEGGEDQEDESDGDEGEGEGETEPLSA